MTIDVADFFPMPSMRPPQRRALEFIYESWQSGKKTVLLDLPTGVGKSPIAIAAANMSMAIAPQESEAIDYNPGTYIVTTQKILQDQYIRDFPGLVANVKAKSNYHCLAHDEYSCHDGYRMAKMAKELYKSLDIDTDDATQSDAWRNIDAIIQYIGNGPLKDFLLEVQARNDNIIPCGDVCQCPYAKAFREWRMSSCSLTNAAFFFNASRMRNLVKPRHLLIIDEAHLLEDELVRHLELMIDRKWIKDMGIGISVPDFIDVLDMVNWLSKTLMPKLKELSGTMSESLLLDTKMKRQAARAETLERKTGDVITMILGKSNEESTEDIVERTKMWILDNDAKGNPTIRPLGLAPFGPAMATSMGFRQIFMSGTILDPSEFCESLGLDESAVAYYGEPSPFPEDNRPIVFMGCGSMAMRSITETKPKVISTIRDLLTTHDGEKGIVHAGTYVIASDIRKFIASERLIFHDDAAGRESLLENHANSQQATVIVSPSMTVGVDLKDDLARWCVICKVPWPFLGDKRVDMLRKLRPSWYAWKTIQALMQACGRVVRSENDCAVVYILDSDFERLYEKSKHIFPKWWRDTLLYDAGR